LQPSSPQKPLERFVDPRIVVHDDDRPA